MPGAPDHIVLNSFALHMNKICRGCYNNRLTIAQRVRQRIREMGGLEELCPTRQVRKDYERAHEFDKRANRGAKIHGMQSEAGKALNGQFCKLIQEDPESKRWTVELVDGERKAIKEDNLECNLENDNDYTAEYVKHMRANPKQVRESIAKQTEERKSQRPVGSHTTWAKVKGIHPGAVVRLKDLTGATELNGRKGRCISFDHESGRWKIDLGDGYKNIKQDNLQPAPNEKPPTKQSAEAEVAAMQTNETRRAKLSEKERAAEDYGWDG